LTPLARALVTQREAREFIIGRLQAYDGLRARTLTGALGDGRSRVCYCNRRVCFPEMIVRLCCISATITIEARLVEGTFMDKTKALDAALLQIECAFGKGSIARLWKNESMGLAMIEATEPEAKLFAVAGQVDLAEKALHDALARRNEAQIAYLREPSIMTREAFEAAKIAEAVALEILDTDVRWLARTRATTVAGLKLKASYASTEGKLADSIVEDILQL